MNENEQLIDQSQLAESVSEKIPYDTIRMFLVKPLEPIKVKKEFDKPVSKTQKPTEDENGIEAIDYDKVETEVKEVESDYQKGIVLKVPYEYEQAVNADTTWKSMNISVGDIVVYKKNAASWFDILKDTILLTSYDIIAVENTNA